ncbi:MAG: HAD family hydrolase [Anaerolineae bacterium]
MTSTVKGVLFDLDNTLIDWRGAGDWSDVERKNLGLVYDYLTAQGCPLKGSLDDLCIHFRSLAVEAWGQARTNLRAPQIITVMERALARFGFTPDEQITMKDVMIAYDWRVVNGVMPFPDVPSALANLREQGIAIGIVTNAWQPMWLRDAELEHHDLIQYFPQANLRISAADVGYLKPHPNIFQHALKELGTRPQETLFIGDNPTADISGAQQAGMRAVLRVFDLNEPTRTMIEPDATIDSLEQLLLLVDNWDEHVTVFSNGV